MSHDERRFDPRHGHRLMSPERQAHWDPPRFLARLGLQPGQTVLDLDCGPGFWTLPLAESVGETGQVWAMDGSQELLDALAARNPPPQVRLQRTELPTIDDLHYDLACARTSVPFSGAPNSGANKHTSKTPANSGTKPTTANTIPPVPPTTANPTAISMIPATILNPRPNPLDMNCAKPMLHLSEKYFSILPF
jgi:Methyltransferase domain